MEIPHPIDLNPIIRRRRRLPCASRWSRPGINLEFSQVKLLIFPQSNYDLTAVQTPLKVSPLNGVKAAVNYPILTFCPASGHRVNSRRLMVPEAGYRKWKQGKSDCNASIMHIMLYILILTEIWSRYFRL